MNYYNVLLACGTYIVIVPDGTTAGLGTVTKKNYKNQFLPSPINRPVVSLIRRRIDQTGWKPICFVTKNMIKFV